MRFNSLLCALVGWLLTASCVLALEPNAFTEGPPPFDNGFADHASDTDTDDGPPKPSALYTSGEYLLWWIKNGPVGAPLLTTGNPTAANGGEVGDPSTRVLFGNRNLDYGAFSGGRVTLGYWLDCDRNCGIEASGFLLESKVIRFSGASDAAGNPLLVMPTRSPIGTENGFVVSTPGPVFTPATGNINFSSSSRLWGGDGNGSLKMWCSEVLRVDLLAGFRYLDLEEDLQDHVQRTLVGVDNSLAGTDRFRTRNQFYGGQVGTRFAYHCSPWSADLTGLVALGSTEQLLNITGSTLVLGTAAVRPGNFPGFVYSQPTNIGSRRHNDFSVVPQAKLKIGYDLGQHLRATAGYDFMCWTNVLRPAQQIDRTVNTSQTPPDTLGGNNQLIGAARPLPLDNKSDIWAQGLSLGLEFSW
jgi:hypothetical protein